MTQQDYDNQLKFFRSLTNLVNIDTQLFVIIREEAAYYFDGSRSLEETVSIIQNRASLYLNETRR